MVNTLVLRDFVSVANSLDGRGLHQEADYLDRLLFKMAADPLGAINRGTQAVERALDRGEQAARGIQENIVEPAQRVLGAGEKTKKITAITFEFVGSIFKGAGTLGSLIEGTRIPGIAFLGTALKMPNEAIGAIEMIKTSMKEIWTDILYPILTRKVGVGAGVAGALTSVNPGTGQREACLGLGDIMEHRDKILMFVTLITGPIGSTVLKALDIGADLMKLDPNVSDLKMCLGVGLNNHAQALNKKAAVEASKYRDSIENLMAVNYQAPRRDAGPYGASLGPSMTA